jgi:hypothetical protein
MAVSATKLLPAEALDVSQRCLCDMMDAFRILAFLVTAVVAGPTWVRCQAPEPRPLLISGGLGLGVSGTPSIWRGGGSPLGGGGYLRVATPTRIGDFGLEWRHWLGRADEILLDGFPPPGAPSVPPVHRTVWVNRTDVMLVALLPAGSAQLKIGLGAARLEGIILAQDCCLDAAGQWKEARSGLSLTLGLGALPKGDSNFGIVPAFDVGAHRVGGTTTLSAQLSIGFSWRREPDP